MKLITEEVSHVEFITEKVGKETKTFIQGVFLQGDICNRNGRMYPMETLAREVNRYNEAFICKGRALGELGHPDGPTVNLDRVSHKIISLEQKGCNFIGKAQLLGTPMGKIAESLIKEGVCLGVSSRGVGSLVQTTEGYSKVSEDFMLSTAADLVHDPSAPSAFVEGIYEGVDWIYNNKKQQWIAENIKSKIESDAFSRKLTEERKLQHFENYLKMM